jgi:crotonobetainyl-CoA:carnitine CoA-transferase CaiB-like acyl-CoA transferase
VSRSDVFLTNYLSPTLSLLGLDYQSLSQHNPRLIYARASGYGARGDERDKPSFDLAAQARGGLMSIIAEAGQHPVDGGVGTVDQAGGLVLALGVVSALLARERLGMGQEINTSLLGTCITLEPMWVQSYLFSGHTPTKPPRSRARNPFWNTYQAGDGKWFVLSTAWSDESWPRLCQVLELSHLEKDPRFDSHQKRVENAKELIVIFDQVFATRSRQECLRHLEAAGQICAPVNNYAEVAEDPQATENQYILPVDHPVLGRSRVVGFPIQFARTPAELRQTAPQLGQHTEEVLLELGYTWEDVGRFKEAGAII